MDIGHPEPWHPVAADYHEPIGDQHGGELGGDTAEAVTPAPWRRDLDASASVGGEHIRDDEHSTWDQHAVDLGDAGCRVGPVTQ
jgi:hypothetical protein